MAEQYIRDDFESTLSSYWTGDQWAISRGALHRNLWDDGEPSYGSISYSQYLDRGNAEIAAMVRVDDGARLGLQMLMAERGVSGVSPDDADGYEFAFDRVSGALRVVIYRLEGGVRTELATATVATAPTATYGARMKGRMVSVGYDQSNAPVQLSLFYDNEDTALVTYTDYKLPCPRGNVYMAVSAYSSSTQETVVDNIILRRLMSTEADRFYSTPTWTWDKLVDQALIRLERGGNPQFPRQTMLEFLAFAEMELVEKCGEPYWLDNIYQLTTSTMINTLPPWIDRVKENAGVITGEYQHLTVVPQARFNFKAPGQDETGPPRYLVFMGRDDIGCCIYYVYPDPSSAITAILNVKVKPGYVDDSSRIPLVPPKHVETLIFGALRRAMSYDTSKRAWDENEKLWAEGRAAIVRDHKRMTAGNTRMIGPREGWRHDGTVKQAPWWKAEPHRNG